MLARKPIRTQHNAKPFKWTEEAMQEAFDANVDIGKLWEEGDIRCNWALARAMVVAGMRADGKTHREIAQRLRVSVTRVPQILNKLMYMAKRRREKLNQCTAT